MNQIDCRVVRRLIFFLCAGLLLLGGNTQLAARDDFGAWQMLSLNLWKEGPHKVYLYGDNRLVDDLNEHYLWVGSLGYKYGAHKNLELATAYTYLDIHNPQRDTWTQRQQIQVEINPRFQLSDKLSVHFRNRLEVWWDDNKGGDDVVRSRFRVNLTRKIDGEHLKKFFANTEAFYNYEKDLLNEFRTIPVGLGLKLDDKTSFNLFYMLHSKRKGHVSDWTHGHVLGTHFVYSF